MSTFCSCIICKKELSIKGFHSHFIRLHTIDGNIATKQYAALSVNKVKQNTIIKNNTARINYANDPTHCKECDCCLPYNKRFNNFCNSSCSAKYNNLKKDYNKFKPGPKKVITVKSKQRKVKEKKVIENQFTKIYLCKCKISNKVWFSPTIKTIHPSITDTRKQYAYQCRFTFSISKYPQWFNYSSKLILTYGWYSAANKGNNLSGCSRDHLLSVYDGFINNIDPILISHPANCEIVPHKLNQSKHKKSKISLDELLLRIELFDKMHES
jgi:hypothetical protein